MIRKLLVASLLTFGLIASAAAQSIPLTGAGGRFKVPTASGGYAGPGDANPSNWVFWYGFRAFNAATIGAPLANVCDNTGANCTDFVSDATGAMVITQRGSNNCAVTGTCRILKLYNQIASTNCTGSIGSNTCDVTNATNSIRPTLTATAINGKTCMTGTTAAGTTLASAALGANLIAQPLTVYAVGKTTRAGTARNYVIAFGSNGPILGYDNVANQITMYANAGFAPTLGGVTDGIAHVLGGLFSTSAVYADGTASSTGNPGSSRFGSQIQYPTGGSGQADMVNCEAGLMSGNQSGQFATTGTTLQTNSKAYFATP